MKRLALSAILLVGTSGPSMAAIDPVFAKSQLSAVVDQCAQDATGPKACAASTLDVLVSLKALDPAPGALDQYIADLVVALVPLAQDDGVCNSLDIAISEAIATAGTFAGNAQREQIVSIAQAVRSCRLVILDLPRREVPSRTT